MLFGVLAVLVAQVAAAPPAAPDWTKDELKQLFAIAQQSVGAPSVQAREAMLLQMAAQAYRVQVGSGSSLERLAEHVLKKRVPEHPAVKAGQWLTALLHQFYLDASKRSDQVSRFERDRQDRQFLEDMARQSKAAADHLGKQIQLVVEGMDEAMEPLPAVGGDPAGKIGALAMLKGDKIVIDNMTRCTFVGDQAKDNERRTARGAIQELYAAQKQYNVQSKMFGDYDRTWRLNGGHLRVAVPALRPAIYLNELVRAGIPAGMHTLHLMTMSKTGQLRELTMSMGATPKKSKKNRGKKTKKKKKSKMIDVHCADNITMDDCARRVLHAKTQGAPRYVPDALDGP